MMIICFAVYLLPVASMLTSPETDFSVIVTELPDGTIATGRFSGPDDMEDEAFPQCGSI